MPGRHPPIPRLQQYFADIHLHRHFKQMAAFTFGITLIISPKHGLECMACTSCHGGTTLFQHYYLSAWPGLPLTFTIYAQVRFTIRHSCPVSLKYHYHQAIGQSATRVMDDDKYQSFSKTHMTVIQKPGAGLVLTSRFLFTVWSMTALLDLI
jgi:hypothetical protein